MTEARPARTRAPYRILAPRLEIRCYEPTDVDAVLQMVSANVEHLSPFMEWVTKRPTSRSGMLDLLLEFRAGFDLARDFTYGMFERDTGDFVGGCGLHPRCGPGALEIGYWVARSHGRRGYATEAAAVLTRVGFEWMKVSRMEIHVVTDNAPSLGVPPKLGYVREAVRRRRTPLYGELRDSAAFIMTDDEYPASAAGRVPMRALDALGETPLELESD